MRLSLISFALCLVACTSSPRVCSRVESLCGAEAACGSYTEALEAAAGPSAIADFASCVSATTSCAEVSRCQRASTTRALNNVFTAQR